MSSHTIVLDVNYMNNFKLKSKVLVKGLLKNDHGYL